MTLRDAFLHPPAIDHPTPFWFWNDVMDPAEVRRQLHLMLDQEMGGAFLHARMGRVTAYMSEAWMDAVAAAVETARERGGVTWIYDEDNWPSGYGGGAVCDLGREYLQRYVRATLLPMPDPRVLTTKDEVIAVYAGRKVDERTIHVTRVPCPVTEPEPDGERRIDLSGVAGEVVLLCWLEVHDVPRYFSPECCVTGYVDVMNPAVTDAFLALIYDKYYQRFGPDFGRTIPGFFFDEPSYLERDWGAPTLRRPWTAALPALYRERTHRDLLDDLPSLFFDTGNAPRVRYVFHECVSDLFVENFTRRLAAWCSAHGVALTGHVILEEHPRAATQTIGNPMAHYEVVQLPGIDHLGRDLDIPRCFWSASRVLVKQAASVAHQLGKPRVMCETFAGGSWDFGVVEQKWMGDFLVTLGTTLICQHACHYSLRGYRKRDYPPSLSFQQPWFVHSAPLHRHFGRLGHLCGLGRHRTDLAMLHPMGSFFATHDVRSMAPRPDPLHDCFKTLSDGLVEAQLDFDYLDEGLLARHGRVEDGRLIIGQASYTTVVIPHLLTIRAKTVDLLRRFLEQGGAVAAIRPFPTRVNGLVDEKVAALFRRVDDLGEWDGTLERTLEWVRRHVVSGVRLLSRPPAPVFVQHRQTEEEDVFLLTADAKGPFEVDVLLASQSYAMPRRWDTASDRVEVLDAWRESEGWRLRLPLDRGLSHVVVIPKVDDGLRPAHREVEATVEVLAPNQPVRAVRLAPNALVLDRCWVRIDNGSWLPQRLAMHVVEREKGSSYSAPLEKGSHVGVRPGQRVTLRFVGRSEIDIAGASLGIETPNAFAITVNGAPLDPETDIGWHIDPSLRRLPLPALPPGEIAIELSCDYDGSQEFEKIFLLGEFDVVLRNGEPWIVSKTDTLTIGDWVSQGLPFYAGLIRMETGLTLEHLPAAGARLRCGALRHTARVFVNGVECGSWLWPPFVVEVGHALHAGENRIEIEVANSLRNFYGPHHLKDEDAIPCLGPVEILSRNQDDIPYQFKPAGLLAPVVLELLR